MPTLEPTSARVPAPVSTSAAGPVAVNDLLSRLETADQQLNSLREQLTESHRLATIGTIAAVIAHEFNNLLTPIISYCQVALTSAEGAQPDETLIRKALSKSLNSATKAARICQSMLGLARGQVGRQRVNVRGLIDETLTVLARDPQKDGIALRVQAPEDIFVWGDAVQLEQVLLNMIINARQAMQGRAGSLSITASVDAERQQVRVVLSDTGSGISPEHLPRIFEPFFTTKGTAARGEARGTGLGLAICKQIIDAHNGAIQVKSEPGRGATFCIYLPVG